jgi:hypothetical protein
MLVIFSTIMILFAIFQTFNLLSYTYNKGRKKMLEKLLRDGDISTQTFAENNKDADWSEFLKK